MTNPDLRHTHVYHENDAREILLVFGIKALVCPCVEINLLVFIKVLEQSLGHGAHQRNVVAGELKRLHDGYLGLAIIERRAKEVGEQGEPPSHHLLPLLVRHPSQGAMQGVAGAVKNQGQEEWFP